MTEEKLADLVLVVLAQERGGEASLSHLMRTLRIMHGILGMGRLDDFGQRLQAMGFTVRKERHGSQVHTFVTV